MRWFGVAMIVAVLAWDADAIRCGVAWYIVLVFAVGHSLDYLTTGNLALRARRMYAGIY